MVCYIVLVVQILYSLRIRNGSRFRGQRHLHKWCCFRCANLVLDANTPALSLWFRCSCFTRSNKVAPLHDVAVPSAPLRNLARTRSGNGRTPWRWRPPSWTGPGGPAGWLGGPDSVTSAAIMECRQTSITSEMAPQAAGPGAGRTPWRRRYSIWSSGLHDARLRARLRTREEQASSISPGTNGKKKKAQMHSAMQKCNRLRGFESCTSWLGPWRAYQSS
jgi:hypothetical protein